MSRHLRHTWEPTPEDPSIQWTVHPEAQRIVSGDTVDVYATVSATRAHDVTTADYDVPHTQTTWHWSVEESVHGTTFAEGSEGSELAAKRAAETHLDQVLADLPA